MIKDIKIASKSNKDSIKFCRSYTGQKSVADMIESILAPRLRYFPFLKDKDSDADGRVPTNQIFSRENNPMIWALLMMIVGCDACTKGVVDSDPKAAEKLLKKHHDASKSEAVFHAALAKNISTMNGSMLKNKEVVCVWLPLWYTRKLMMINVFMKIHPLHCLCILKLIKDIVPK